MAKKEQDNYRDLLAVAVGAAAAVSMFEGVIFVENYASAIGGRTSIAGAVKEWVGGVIDGIQSK